MKITISCTDLIKLCLWDHYVYYILQGSEKEAERLLKENNEMVLSDQDALVIGLLKIIQTDNLIHKFNTNLMEFLTNKSMKQNEYLLIRKKTLDLTIDKFLDKFPSYWEPGIVWSKSLKDLTEYIDAMKEEVSKLEIHKIIDKNVTYEFYNSNNVRKLLKFNY